MKESLFIDDTWESKEEQPRKRYVYERDKVRKRVNSDNTKKETQIFSMESIIISDINFLLTQHIFIIRRWHAEEIVDGWWIIEQKQI